MGTFTKEQLEMFAHIALEKAKREAALCYPAGDGRIKWAEQEMMMVYYRQFITPICACCCHG